MDVMSFDQLLVMSNSSSSPLKIIQNTNNQLNVPQLIETLKTN